MSRILFGLIPAVACARAPVAYPLCDVDGAPACGNVGQTGRPGTRAPVRVPPVRVEPAGAVPVVAAAGSLLAPGVNEGVPVARPLLDGRARPAPGNCAGKCDDASEFELQGEPVGGERPAMATAPYRSGSRIAAVGAGTLVIDEDSGNLILADERGHNVAYVAIGRGAGMLVYDPIDRLAYVADRRGNRIVAVRVGDQLEAVRAWATPNEPYGLALSPDRRTLYAVAIADRVVVAYDAQTGAERWRAPTSAEPRGIALSADGTRAAIASLASGGVDRLELATRRPSRADIALPRDPRFQSFARGAFAVAFLGDGQVVVPFQRERPADEVEHASSGYGGGSGPSHPELAFLTGTAQARVRVPTEVPRALAWDGAHDALYVAGMGTDLVQEVADASQRAIRGGRRIALTGAGEPRCGPDGIAIGARRTLLVWCAFTRKIARLDLEKRTFELGPQLVASSLSAPQHAGMVAFHASDPKLSAGGGLACATCHPEGRSDGLSWRVEKQIRQTPVLAGRVAGTHPFKWDGADATLGATLASTVKHLGGRGIDRDTTARLVAYLESMPALATPHRDPEAVARGHRAFDARGCNDCHDGARYTDGKRHALRGGLPSDTPSLLGLAASAPYYHDGSAPTLEVLLRGGGKVHMTDARPTDREIADLTAFLETL